MTSVLVVEDQRTQAVIIESMLRDAYEVIDTVDSAEETVAAVEEHDPDVVVMDIGLASGDGLHVTAELTSMADSPTVVISSAFDEDYLRQEAFEAGAAAYLRKPYDEETLHGAIESALDRDG